MVCKILYDLGFKGFNFLCFIFNYTMLGTESMIYPK